MASPVRITRKPLPTDLKKEPILEIVETNDSDIVEQPPAAYTKSLRILGWELSAHRLPSIPHKKPRQGQRVYGLISEKFDRAVPPNRKYLGKSRRTFLIILAVICLLLFVLIVGLAVGLTVGKKGPKDLPLPSNSQQHTGDLTYYAPALGACGIVSTDSDSIVAVSHYVFDAMQKGSDPNSNPLCGKKIRAMRYNNEVGGWRSMDVTVVDRCVGCQPNDLDTTTSVFDQLADQALGRVNVTWAWLST